ncbi:hypothetical protein [Nocardia arthritidis]|uniref:Uncharacterized protein n=1 Tax=Nocardia arthritidis TaxID=228602 RepID=A0A6G9YR43_9NOCA|nr:hypothetical protein [Nocardia arthritidis]QIS15779.1 hypothetical protein F5544_39805 [Nocardia arthritidis]
MSRYVPAHAARERTVHALDRNGYVRDWLIAPVWSAPCRDLDEALAADGSPWGTDGRWVLTNGPDVAPLKELLYDRLPIDIAADPPTVSEGAAFSWRPTEHDTHETAWERAHIGADGLLDWSEFCFTPEYRAAIAATVLEVDQAEERTLEVACTGPVAVYLDGELRLFTRNFTYMEPRREQLRVRLRSGRTAVHLLTWQLAFRECRHIASLRVIGLPVRVVIPARGADEFRSAAAESILDALGCAPWASIDGTVTLTGPAGARYLVESDGNPPTAVTLVDGTASLTLSGAAVDDSTASMLATGETTLTVRVDDSAAPVLRRLRAARVPGVHRTGSADDPAIWRSELLRHVADGVPGVARALARHALEPGAKLRDEDLDPALAMIESRSDCADFEAVGLVHLWRRLDDAVWAPTQRDRVRRALVGFKYWIDQPGLDAMCYFTENHQFVWHTAETLVGDLFPDEVFGNTGWPGRRHAAHGRELAAEWMRRKLSGGFSEFDSNAYLAIDALALVSWIEFGTEPPLRRLAEALLDKALLTLAGNSWRGVHGAAHGRSYVPTLRSSRFEETAPIMWTLWGAGSLNTAVLPATALATARCYRTPDLVRAVATELPGEWDGRQVYRGDYRWHHDLLERPYGSDLRVWRTPDAMLSSVQDYRPGLPGLQEHIWGATLGPEIQVFATHPATASTSSSARPNAWAGQRVLPRAHQHLDTVLVLHRIPEPDLLGTTHLWFPTPHFDEWIQHGPWLSGRAGNGYVAVATEGGFRPVSRGDEARQAWLPRGSGLGYVATVGRAATDGSFSDFVSALTTPDFASDSIAVTTRDGRALALSWPGAFTVDGAADFAEPPHLDNPALHLPFGADRLEAEWGGHRLVLDLSEGRRVEPPSGVPGAGDAD